MYPKLFIYIVRCTMTTTAEEMLVKTYLNQLGIYMISGGHNEILECVLLVIQHKRTCKGKVIIGDIYKKASIELHKSADAIDKCIRHCIKKCINENRIGILNTICGRTVYIDWIGITNSDFIGLLADKVEEDIYQEAMML